MMVVASVALVVLIAVVVSVTTLAMAEFLRQHVLSAPPGQVAHAAHYRVIRRHRESLRAWEKRTVVAADALADAEEAFVAAASVERVANTHAGLKWSLPSTHPLAIALVLARYPDGPPELERQRIALGEVMVVGLDLVRALR